MHTITINIDFNEFNLYHRVPLRDKGYIIIYNGLEIKRNQHTLSVTLSNLSKEDFFLYSLKYA